MQKMILTFHHQQPHRELAKKFVSYLFGRSLTILSHHSSTPPKSAARVCGNWSWLHLNGTVQALRLMWALAPRHGISSSQTAYQNSESMMRCRHGLARPHVSRVRALPVPQACAVLPLRSQRQTAAAAASRAESGASVDQFITHLNILFSLSHPARCALQRNWHLYRGICAP